MAQYHPRLSKESFSGYIRLGLALKITREGLGDLVKKETDDFHEKLLLRLSHRPPCSQCQIENILDCPTAGFCQRKHCPFHSSQEKRPCRCPNDICNIFRDSIRQAHSQYQEHVTEPSWKHAIIRKWSIDPFEIMKCFLPHEGYEHVKSMEEVDFNGCINYIINNKCFQDKLSDDIQQKDSICSKSRYVGEFYCQSNSLTISDAKLSECLVTLIALLQDSKVLLQDKKAKTAVDKLTQLKAGTLKVSTTDVKQTLTDVIATLGEEAVITPAAISIREKEHDIKKAKWKLLKDVHTLFSKETRTIKACQLELMMSDHQDTIHNLKEAVTIFQKSVDAETSKHGRKSTEEDISKRGLGEYTSDKRKRTKRISVRSDESNLETYEQNKTELRQNLIAYYQERHSSLPLSPLIEKNKAPLLEFYVQPTIKIVDLDRGLFDGKMHTTYRNVEELADIFNGSEKSKVYKNICLTSPPGTGKTSFVKHLTLTWCNIHSAVEKDDKTFTSENKGTMKQFEFVFLIPLRDAKEECDQDAMIQNLLISQLESEYKFDHVFLQMVLQKEKCLVIMDGLDEWRHPKATIKACKQGRSNFPHRKVRNECTLLFTTRPWTLDKVKRENINADRNLEMPGLGLDSSRALIKNVIMYLNNHTTGKQMSNVDFLQMLSRKGLQKFQKNPVILMQLLCLWFEGNDPGESQCEIYGNMLELLFRRAELEGIHRHGKRGKHQTKLPLCFSNNGMCKRNAKLLVSLGKLSFVTLFRGRKESLYIFDKTVVMEYLEEADLQTCLRAGILTQSEQGRLTTENVIITFLHKTFQEFFAALYITSKSKLSDDDEKKLFENHDSLRTVIQLETVLAFVCGFSHLHFSKLTHRMREIVSKDKFTRQYRENIGTLFLENKDYMTTYCQIIVKPVKELSYNEISDLENVCMEDIYVDKECTDEKYAKALGRVIEMNRHSIKSLVIHVKQTIAEEDIEMIMEMLDIRSIYSLEKLFVWGDIPHVLLQSILDQSRHTLKCLELWDMSLFLGGIEVISRLDHVEAVSFLGLHVSHSDLCSLMSAFMHRCKLRQFSLNSITCTDHFGECPGHELTFSEEARPYLLVLDKVNLKDVKVNTENLGWCVVEWLGPPGVLKILLRVLNGAKSLQRFEYDGRENANDTTYLVKTVSSLAQLEYLRLRHVNFEELSVNISKMQSLKCVHMCNVNMKSHILKMLIAQIKDLGHSVNVLMDNCIVTPDEDYKDIVTTMRPSNGIEVLFSADDGINQLHFKTVYSGGVSENTQKKIRKDTTVAWQECLCQETTIAQQTADNLLKNGILPDKRMLNRLCNHFGKKDKLISNISSWLCSYIKRKSNKILHVYSSFTVVCNDDIVFVIIVKEDLSSREKSKLEYAAIVRLLGEYSPEGKTVMLNKANNEALLTLKEAETLKKCINKNAATLMQKHKYLSIINASRVRSKGFGTEYPKITREPCIALYVFTKGYIPLDEESFQTHYDGIPVDVREGIFEIYPDSQDTMVEENLDSLKLGCQIGSTKNKNSETKRLGTLGGFIQHPQYGLCGLTCAHVLLHSWGMVELKDEGGTIHWPKFNPYEIVYQPGNSNNAIGKIVQAVYQEGKRDTIGIEVAIFQIEKRYPISGEFQDQDNEERFDSGKSYGCSRLNRDCIVKIGSVTGKTFGRFEMNEPAVSVKTLKHQWEFEECKVTLHNQLAVIPEENGEQNKFADFGDSGSLVLMKDEDSDYVCVGMVEGGTSYGMTIVTPISPILEAFNVTSLKGFETEKLTDQIRNLKTEIKSEFQIFRDSLLKTLNEKLGSQRGASDVGTSVQSSSGNT